MTQIIYILFNHFFLYFNNKNYLEKYFFMKITFKIYLINHFKLFFFKFKYHLNIYLILYKFYYNLINFLKIFLILTNLKNLFLFY